jgi:hypothetical protein
MISTMAELERARASCRKLVTKRSLFSAATAAIPSGLVGAASDVVNLMNLLPRINRAFGLDPEQIDELDEQMKEQIAIMAGKLGNAFIGRYITETLVLTVVRRFGVQMASKTAASYVPVIGSGVAAGISFGMMKFVGNSHIDECYDLVRALIQRHPDRPATAPSAAA